MLHIDSHFYFTSFLICHFNWQPSALDMEIKSNHSVTVHMIQIMIDSTFYVVYHFFAHRLTGL